MSNLIRPTNPNQILKLATGLLFVFVLGIVVPNEGFACHKGEPHGPHTCDGPTDPPGTTDPTTLTPCGYDENQLLCLASVGKWRKPAARLYVEYFFGENGSYTEIPPNVFGDILAALPEGNFQTLCDAYNVLIFQWKSPGIKNLTWQSLVDYMACGGGIIFEDPSNVDALVAGVTAENIHVKSISGSPLTIAFDSECFHVDRPKLCSPLPHGTELQEQIPDTLIYEFDIDNNHMEFAEPQTTTNPVLKPFLRLLTGEVVGLYGELVDGDKVQDVGPGRIVLTGPDNSFHGNYPHGEYDPLAEAHHNQYELLSNEIDWLLGIQ